LRGTPRGTVRFLWGRSTTFSEWTILGRLKQTKAGPRVLPTLDAPSGADLSDDVADGPIRGGIQGCVERAPTLDYPGPDDDP
jgi:hypothetical protein